VTSRLGTGKSLTFFTVFIRLQCSLFIRLSTALYLVHAALGVEAGRVWTCALGVPRPALLLQQLTHQALNRLLHLKQRKAITYIEQNKKSLLFKVPL
jgi:hypothetical protein